MDKIKILPLENFIKGTTLSEGIKYFIENFPQTPQLPIDVEAKMSLKYLPKGIKLNPSCKKE